MIHTFDKRVQYSVEKLWITMELGKGEEALQSLLDAAHEGDGDAYYFLGRCYSGPCYIDRGFHFPEDDALAKQYYDKSLQLGSAVGMFGAMRLSSYRAASGKLNPLALIHPPYHSLKEIWDVVAAMADAGETFCQYLIATAYYYNDPIHFFSISIGSKEEAARIEHKWAKKAIEYYEKCVERGMPHAIGNLYNLLNSGEAGIPKQPKRADELRRLGAQKGISFFQIELGDEYAKNNQPDLALALFQKALEQEDWSALASLGDLYSFRGAMPRDLPRAKKYYEESLAHREYTTYCHNRLGEIYFYGGDGIAPDYKQAFSHLIAAHNAGNHWGSGMLGTCYLKGLGVRTDYQKAMELFELNLDEELSAIGVGELFAYGLGFPTDIGLAMEYWNKFPQNERVIENKKNFKRAFLCFGWKRRDSYQQKNKEGF